MKKYGLTTEANMIAFIKENSNYKKIKKIGISPGWGNRPIFMCEV